MGLFKNEVGRPSNETIKKRNIFKGVCFILVLIIIGLVVLLLNEKGIISINNGKQENNSNKVDDNKIVEKDISYGEKILNDMFNTKSLINFMYFDVDTFNSDVYKTYLAIDKTESSKQNIKCEELFDNTILSRVNGDYYPNSYNISIGNDEYLMCTDGENILYNYEDVNKNYKKLFGNKNNADKKDFHIYYGIVERFGYSNKKDSFVSLSCQCGDGGFSYLSGIPRVYEQNNKLYIVFVYSVADYNGETNGTSYWDLKLNDGTSVKISDTELKDKETYKKYQDKLDKYTFTFFKEDDIYKFEKVEKVTNN